ncbi:MAG: prepilin peptidase [Candidatus Shapirobacteria bacterium]|nr:prepilin peptidase [Candidatus Shapirobacteria bacterium]MDD3002314.1 prepilin peptidase [Candidatus Shapirobacteria bacterium]MDD4382681.1 prepilin peptidase [Candidatus Shapirobacteria bacterium]
MEILIGVIVFVLGLCFGSFVNMLVYRTAVDYKLENKKFKVKGEKRSFCDYCGRQLKWYENIPVFSWLILKGKTKCCHKKLPLSYPVVELVMGFLFLISVFIGRPQESPLQFGLGFLIIVFLVFSAVFDLKYMILPDFSTVILIMCGLVLLVGTRHGAYLQNIIVALGASGFLLILNLITKGNGMGMGDVKLAIFMGLFLGGPKTILAFYVAFIVGAIVGLILMIFKKATKKSQVPFGPFMILGILVAWWWGEKVVELIKL